MMPNPHIFYLKKLCFYETKILLFDSILSVCVTILQHRVCDHAILYVLSYTY